MLKKELHNLSKTWRGTLNIIYHEQNRVFSSISICRCLCDRSFFTWQLWTLGNSGMQWSNLDLDVGDYTSVSDELVHVFMFCNKLAVSVSGWAIFSWLFL